MTSNELKERLAADFQKLQERLEESSAYNQIRDRFRSLSAIQQRLILSGVSILFVLFIVSVPYSHFDTSRDNISQFEAKRNLLKDLLHVQKEINETPDIPVPPNIEALKSRIQSELQGSNLLPEQIKSVSDQPPVQNNYIKSAQNDGVVEVNLTSLNLKQIVDIGTQLIGISPSVKLKDLVVQASGPGAGYFDVVYRLLVLKIIPEEPMPVDEPKGKGKPKDSKDADKGKR